MIISVGETIRLSASKSCPARQNICKQARIREKVSAEGRDESAAVSTEYRGRNAGEPDRSQRHCRAKGEEDGSELGGRLFQSALEFVELRRGAKRNESCRFSSDRISR